MVFQKFISLIFYSGKKKLVGILSIILLFIAIPLTVFVSQKQQEIRQRAEGDACITASFPLKVPVLALEYFPLDLNDPNLLDGVETGWGRDATINGRTISFWEQKTDEMIDAVIAFMNQSTNYHGYKDPTSPQFLNFSVLERKKIYEPIPKGFKLTEKTYRPNYAEILTNFDICDYVDNKGVKEAWMYGYHNNNGIEPDESRMSSKYGDISNSYPKENEIPQEYRIPICKNSYVLYNFTYQPGGESAINNSIHNRLHQIENIIPFAENKWPPIREDRQGSNIKGSVFWGNFSEYVQDYTNHNDYISSCGNSHYAPNWRRQGLAVNGGDDYVYNLIDKRENNCETWNPDSSKSTYVNAGCSQWGCTDLGFYKWYMQNIPGYNNGIVYNDQKMKNWWEAMYDFNAFIDKGRSLFGESLFCSSQPESTSTPTPTSVPSELTPVPPTPTFTPTPRPTNTSTPVLTSTPTPTPAPVPGDNLVIFDSINFGGIFDANSTVHPDKNIAIYLYGIADDPGQDVEGKTVTPKNFPNALRFNTAKKSYESSPLNIGNIPDGTKVLIKIDKYLRKIIQYTKVALPDGVFAINVSSSNTDFVPGDIDGDNAINIKDYNVIAGCFQNKDCNNKDMADLNEDGTIDGIDYNIFLKSLSLTSRNGD